MLTLTIRVGVRGSYDPDRWNTHLSRFGLTAAKMEQLMRALVSQSLRHRHAQELTDMYNSRYAALHNAQKW